MRQRGKIRRPQLLAREAVEVLEIGVGLEMQIESGLVKPRQPVAFVVPLLRVENLRPVRRHDLAFRAECVGAKLALVNDVGPLEESRQRHESRCHVVQLDVVLHVPRAVLAVPVIQIASQVRAIGFIVLAGHHLSIALDMLAQPQRKVSATHPVGIGDAGDRFRGSKSRVVAQGSLRRYRAHLAIAVENPDLRAIR